jgi:hypothetical protein
MPSTASATAKLAPTRRAMLQRFLVAMDAFHAAEQSIDAGVDPSTGGELAEASRGHALSAATARLTEAFHVAIDAGWKAAADEARTTLWGGRPATVQAERVLESEIARQKAFASRFALDVARGETETGRKIHEPTRAAMYTDATTGAFNVGASTNAPDGTLIFWNLGDAVHCRICPTVAASSPYTRESLPLQPQSPSLPCGSRCHCFLSFKQLEGSPKPPTPEDINKDRRFEERVFNPPPVPDGMRLPNPEERGVLRDLEIQRNFARRKQADSEAAGDKAGARIWQRKSRDLTKQLRETSEAAGVHHVPTFGVKDIINGRDIGQRDIDRLTHFRGIDGVTVSRAQVAAIHEAAAAAKADVLKILKDYPAVDPISREDFRRLLRESGAPESAFGGPLFRLGTEAHDHDEAVTLRGRAAMGLVAAIEAAVPSESAVELPKPANWLIVNIVAESARETLELVPDALTVLGNAGRRTGVDAYRVEVGPLNDLDLVAEGGVWVQGDREEVDRYLTALRAVAVFAVAPWQPMG